MSHLEHGLSAQMDACLPQRKTSSREKENRGMRFHKTLTVLLIDLPFRLRLGIVVLSYLLCLALFALVFLPSHNGSILAIPLALSSWMFKRRGALIGLGCTLLALVVFNSPSVGGLVAPPFLGLASL